MAHIYRDELAVCTDCALIIANDDDSGAPEGHRARMRDGATLLVISGDAQEFGRYVCDSCGEESEGPHFSECVEFASSEQETFIRRAVAAYIVAALWSTGTVSEDGEWEGNLDDTYGPDDLSDEARASVDSDVSDFVLSNWNDVRGIDAGQVGHDFLLTRDRHGTGFWDRGLGELGERCTKASHPYGESGFYVGDDGAVHCG